MVVVKDKEYFELVSMNETSWLAGCGTWMGVSVTCACGASQGRHHSTFAHIPPPHRTPSLPKVYPRSPLEFRILVSAFRKPATRLSLTSWDTGTYYSHQCAGLGHTDTSMGVICASVCVP